MNRDDFQALSQTRLADARTLLDAERYDAAYYLAGYSVECALKACLCKQIREHHFPPRNTDKYYSHQLVTLAREAGVEEVLEANSDLRRNWNIVKDWSEQTRYELGEDSAKIRAERLMAAIADEDHGVLGCLFKHW